MAIDSNAIKVIQPIIHGTTSGEFSYYNKKIYITSRKKIG